jgi:hypothetical protein
MVYRKWMVRGIVYGIISVAAIGALVYQRWTNPGAVREQVIAEIGKTFPGAHVSVDSARLRILGGIQLIGLRLTRDDDDQKREFLHVPSAIFYHDKEKILDGELTLRKIELIRPRLRIRRERDGSWNFKDLMGPSKPDEPLTSQPAIVIHQGTLVFEDRSIPGKYSSIEVNDISLTIINDPLPRLKIHGAANTELLGKLQLQGSIDRASGETDVAFKAAQIPLTQVLLSRLPVQCPNDVLVGLQLNATVNIEGKLSYQPGQAEPMYYDVHAEVQNGKVQHPKLALPLDNLNLKVHCNNGELQLESLSAQSGTAEIEARGNGKVPCIDQDFELHLDLKHVMLGPKLQEKLPEKLRELHEMFHPDGPITIHIACARRDGEWALLSSGHPSQVSLRPEKVTAAFNEFYYPLEQVTGDIDYNLLNSHIEVRLQAKAGPRDVFVNGHWTGEDEKADVDFDIKGYDIPIDAKLVNALPPGLKTFVESFHATGRIDVKSRIRREPGKEFRNEYHIHVKDSAVKWDSLPVPLSKVNGFIDVYPEHWTFNDFQASHKGGQVVINGKSIPRDDKGFDHGISLDITGTNITLDDEFADALRHMKEMHKTWETFRPSGLLNFKAVVHRPSADLKDLEVFVKADGCSAKPTFFPYRMQDISGNFRFHKMRLEIDKLRAKHEQAVLGLDHGAVDLNPRGGYYAKLDDIQIQGLQVDEEFTQALPKKLQDFARALKLNDPLKLKTQVVISQPPETGKPPDIFWDGQLWMYEARFTTGLEFKNVTGTLACVGRVNGNDIVGIDGNLLLDRATLYDQPFKKVHAKFQMRDTSPDIMLVGVRAPLFGGDVTGQIRVDLNTSLRYDMNLTLSQMNMAEWGQHNLGPKSQLSGAANARLYLRGFGTGLDSLEGNGAIDIPRGHLYNLPFLLDLLKFLGLHWPDRTAFEEFHAGFAIQGPKLQVQRLDLLGAAVSLSGKGDLDLNTKDVKLDVYPMWGRVEQLLPPMLRPYPTTFSKNLLTVEVRGKVSSNPKDLKFQLKPMPVIVDPLLLLRDRMTGQGNNETPEVRRGLRIWD